MKIEKTRIQYIDKLRGFAIILVVMGHALEHNGYRSTLYNFIYSFHMPIFFCISGFVTMYACSLSTESKIIDHVKYICKKFLAIMLPFFSWTLVVFPFFFLHSLDDVKTNIQGVISSLTNNTGLWFLPCLFILLVVFTLWMLVVNKIKQKSPVLDAGLWAIAWGGVITMQSIDHFRSVSSYIIPFFVGVIMARYSSVYSFIVKNKAVFTISLVSFCLVVGFYGNVSGLANKTLRLTTGLLALPVLFHIFDQSSFGNKFGRILSELGKKTLVIYVLNYHLVKGIPVPQNMGVWSQMLVFSFIAVLFSYSFALVARILENSPFLSFCLLGKHMKEKRGVSDTSL